MLNINAVKNETIKKLTRHEIGDLDLLNNGIYTYKGILKSRTKFYKRVLFTESEVHFEAKDSHYRLEFIKIVKTFENLKEGEEEYALRVYDLETEKYESWYPVLMGCDFFK